MNVNRIIPDELHLLLRKTETYHKLNWQQTAKYHPVFNWTNGKIINKRLEAVES